MTNLSPELTAGQQWAFGLKPSYQKIAGWYEALAKDVEARYQALWGMSDSDINAAIATLGIESFQAVCQLHAETVAHINRVRDALASQEKPIFIKGCTEGLPRQLTIQDGALVVVPLPQPPPAEPPAAEDQPPQ